MDRSVRQSMDPVRRGSMDRGSVFSGHPVCRKSFRSSSVEQERLLRRLAELRLVRFLFSFFIINSLLVVFSFLRRRFASTQHFLTRTGYSFVYS